jgi:hypothetical protein
MNKHQTLEEYVAALEQATQDMHPMRQLQCKKCEKWLNRAKFTRCYTRKSGRVRTCKDCMVGRASIKQRNYNFLNQLESNGAEHERLKLKKEFARLKEKARILHAYIEASKE